MRRPLALIAGATLALAACAGPSSGYIEKKNYAGPWTEYQQQCLSYDKSGFCTFYVPIFIQHPEECDFYLNDGKDKGWTAVPCGLYGDYAEGDHYPDAR